MLIRPLHFTLRKMTKTLTSISRKICCVKSGFQILYAVEQFNSLKLKQGAHIHQTLDPLSPRMLVGELPCGSQPTAPTCVVWNWTSLCRKGSLYTGFPQSLTNSYAMLTSPSIGETAVHGCHCPRDMAVCMREIMAMPWVGVCAPLALTYW